MPYVHAIILGLVQGLAEFVPVSSSAHLVILPWLLGWTDPLLKSLAFDVALHLGTLVALVAYFAGDWRRLAAAWWRSLVERRIGSDPDRRMAWYLVVACVPGALSGLAFEGRIEDVFHPEGKPILASSMLVMAFLLAALGALLFAADKFGRRRRPLAALGWKDAIAIGLAQAFAIFPGVSRSGSTITAGLALGLEREAAARFSFLLSAPIIAGACAKSLLGLARELGSGAIAAAELPLIPIGIAVAGVSGFLCIKLLLDFLKRRSTLVFAYYRWGLAILVAATAILRG